jgi:hypothetical protein
MGISYQPVLAYPASWLYSRFEERMPCGNSHVG